MEPIEPPEAIAATPPLRAFRWRDIFRAFRHRNYRLFFSGQLISLVGTWMNTTAEGWLVYQLTNSKVLLGVVAAASTGPMLLLSSFGGWLADHYPKRSILVVTQICSMAIALTLAFLVWHGSVQTWQLILCATFGGIVLAFDMPARQAFVIEMTSRDDLVNAISLNSAAFNGARIIGPSLAGLLMAKLGIAACFLIDGISFLAVIAGLLMMRLAPHIAPIRRESVLTGIISAVRYIRNTPRLLRIFVIFALVGVFGMSYSVLMPAIARDTLHAREEVYGLLLGANGAGALLGALTVAALGHVVGPRKLALGGLALFAVVLALFAFSTHLLPAMILLALMGLGIVLFFSAANSAVQLIVKHEMRGRVMGLWSLVFGGAVPVGSLFAGGMAHYFGAPATLFVAAILCAGAALGTVLHIRREENASR